MLTLSNLSPSPGARKQKKRLGRGPGSGHGKTSARGHKGYKSRSGSSIRPGFEGGQMPLHRRLPKRGFNNIFKKCYEIVNIKDLDKLETDNKITREILLEAGLIGKQHKLVKVLGDGEVRKKLNLYIDKISKSAKEKIENAGGTVELIVST
jgi:large subunit ribosomal protein L15